MRKSVARVYLTHQALMLSLMPARHFSAVPAERTFSLPAKWPKSADDVMALFRGRAPMMSFSGRQLSASPTTSQMPMSGDYRKSRVTKKPRSRAAAYFEDGFMAHGAYIAHESGNARSRHFHFGYFDDNNGRAERLRRRTT